MSDLFAAFANVIKSFKMTLNSKDKSKTRDAETRKIKTQKKKNLVLLYQYKAVLNKIMTTRE